MEIDPNILLKELIGHYSDADKFKKLIEPIILKKDLKCGFDSVELINRLAYTIVDQQRDVESIIIPIWVTMMAMNMNPDFLAKSPYASDFVQSMFKAYGHQNYHTKDDFSIRERSGASRTDAFIELYNAYNPEEFLGFVLENSHDIDTIFKELVKLKFISLKSASFFLRDVEGLEYDILPVDVNVAYSFQYTGLFFNQRDSFEEVLDSIIPVFKRTKLAEYSTISDNLKNICSEFDFNPYGVNRYLFLLGADYCQSLKCNDCFLSDNCYFNNLSDEEKEKFYNRIKSD